LGEGTMGRYRYLEEYKR